MVGTALDPLGAAALPRFLAHSAAGAAAGCAALHGLALVAAPHPGTALLVAACLTCSVHLWRRPGRAAWAAHVVLTTAMLAVHPPVLSGHAHHPATGLAVWAGPVAGLLATVALLLAGVRGTARCAVLAGARPSAPPSCRPSCPPWHHAPERPSRRRSGSVRVARSISR
jgi:hypothetical protein